MGAKKRKAVSASSRAKVPVFLNNSQIGEALSPVSAADKLASNLKKGRHLEVGRDVILSAMVISRNAFSLKTWDLPPGSARMHSKIATSA
jgi:hypothetical protein